MMIIDIRKLNAQKSYFGEMEFSYNAPESLLNVPLAVFDGPISVKFEYDLYEDNALEIRGKVSYRLKGQCSRCLSDVSVAIEGELNALFEPTKDAEDYSYTGGVVDITQAVEDAVMLTVFSAVALSEVIEEVSGVTPGIKWVNDIFLGGKKLAGILAEGEFSEGGEYFEYAVVGIGVNLHGMALPPEISNIATTLEAECGIKVDIADFALRLAKKLRSFTETDASSYMDSYRKKSIVIGKKVRMTRADEVFDAEVLGIEDNGAIRVLLNTGEVKNLSSAEVSVIF